MTLADIPYIDEKLQEKKDSTSVSEPSSVDSPVKKGNKSQTKPAGPLLSKSKSDNGF